MVDFIWEDGFVQSSETWWISPFHVCSISVWSTALFLEYIAFSYIYPLFKE